MKKNMVIPWLSLSCILMGMLLGFNSMFECNIWLEGHILPVLLIAGAVLFLVLYLRANYAVICTLSAIAGLGIFALVRIEKLQQDFLSVIYYINNKSIAYNNKVFAPFEGAKGNMDFNLFLFVAGALFAVFIAFFVFRLFNCWYGMLPVYAVLCIGMMVGKTPDKASVAFLIAGISLAMAWVSHQDHGGRRGFFFKKRRKQRPVWMYAILCLVLAVGLAAAWQYGVRTENYVLKDAKKYLMRQHEFERRVKNSVEELLQYVRAKTGIDSDGILDNSEPQYAHKAVIKLTVASKPRKALYLRGFVGGEYENGKWKKCDTESFQKILPEEEDAEAVLDAGYDFCDSLKGSSNYLIVRQIEIEHTGAGKASKFAYLPYFSDSGSVMDDDSERCITLDGENGILKEQDKYYVNYYEARKEDLNDLVYSVGMNGDEAENAMRVVTGSDWNCWSMSDVKLKQYFDYVKESYRNLPETGLDRLKELADVALLSEYAAASNRTGMVRKLLASQAVYDKKLNPVPAGKDYAEYFLFDQKKGFCEHFATAGTLLLRACHVPARYAAGYKVAPDQFQENEDGSYTAVVLDSDAHAWSEVFDARYGWYPAEMTPGEGETKRRDENTPPAETLSPAVQDEEETKQAERPKETETPKPKTAQDDGEGKGGKADQEKNVFPAVLSVIILFILTPISYVAYQRRLQKKYRKELQNKKEDKNAAIRIRTEIFLHLLKKCGKKRLLQKNEAEWFALLAEEYKETEEGIWQQLKEILQEAEFSGQSVSTEKYDFFFETIAKTERLILSKLSWIKRGYLRILGCMELREKSEF